MLSSTHYLCVVILLLLFSPQKEAPVVYDFPDAKIVLCSSVAVANKGTCTGSAYCTACTTCNYCKHCNSGGTCGVCTPSLRRSYTKPKTYTPPRRNTSPTYKSRSRSNTPKSYSRSTQIQRSEDYFNKAIYIVTQRTSLRAKATHESNVLQRLAHWYRSDVTRRN